MDNKSSLNKERTPDRQRSSMADSPKARADQPTIKHETIPGASQKGGSNKSQKEKAATSTADEDLN